jgi:MFS transporter, DHA2 family, multidrug resistance protein
MPMVDPALFRSRASSWGAVLSGMAGLCVAGLLFSMPQYFQAVQGADAMESGLKMLPWIRDAFAYGLDVSLLATAGIALAGLILTLTFAPRTRPAGHAGATIPDGAHAGRS